MASESEEVGLEFRAVAVMACDDGARPVQEPIAAISNDSELEEVDGTKRHPLLAAWGSRRPPSGCPVQRQRCRDLSQLPGTVWPVKLSIGLEERMPIPARQLRPVSGSHGILIAPGTVALVADDLPGAGLLTTHRPLASEPTATGVQPCRTQKPGYHDFVSLR